MYEWNDDKMYPRMMALKKQNPSLKVLLAVGGWNHENGNGQGLLYEFFSSDITRSKFNVFNIGMVLSTVNLFSLISLHVIHISLF